MLDIVASYHCIQYQGKLITQTQKNGEKPHFEPDISPLGLNSCPKDIFSKYRFKHHGQLSCTISQKLMIQS